MHKNININTDKHYTTSEVAKIIGIHPNTVRMYEQWELISKPCRKENGYRIYTNLHLQQFKVARLAFQVEIVYSGLRKQSAAIVKACAGQDFEKALNLTSAYIDHLRQERKNAEKAIAITEDILSGKDEIKHNMFLARKETAELINVTMDTLRNWELNGLISVKRKQNGYRVYNSKDINLLIIIKSLRNANYSLSSILRMLNAISCNPKTDIRSAIDTSENDDDIITACDTLLTSLNEAENNAHKIYNILTELKKKTF